MKTRRLAAGALSIALAVTMLSTTAFAASVKFSDVPDSHWASTSISKMADKGIMSGIGNNLFAPSNTLTGAEFVTMIVRHFYEDKLGTEGEKWYSEFMDAAKRANILTGTNVTAEGTINRYDMAQLMYNVLKAEGINTTPLSDTSKVADWASVPSTYRDAVSVCYNMGMLSGVDSKGTFNGTGVMDRAQAAVVMNRLLEVCSGGMPSTPTVPEKPAGSLTLTNDNILSLSGDGSKYEDGIFHLYNSGFEGSGGYIQFINNGYSTLTFTVTAHAQQMVAAGGNDSVDGDIRLMEEVGANGVKTFCVDISGIRNVTICIFDGRFCDAEVSNIYLS